MKKLFVCLLFSVVCLPLSAQSLRFGVKAGANFANVDAQDVSTDNMTSWHAGAVLEINVLPTFSIQPEALYSSQGAKVEGAGDFNFDYISVPVLARFYLLPDVLSLDAGPQFSFLVNDDVDETFETKSFDFAIAGGATVNVTKNLFAQARYVVGLTDTTEDAEVTNKVIQLSLGYRF
ncbi:MAG TPA: porin family protein [Flavobacterium sp.]|nr:porin family protein [Flavobacterium sp.]